jgi:peroxin-3
VRCPTDSTRFRCPSLRRRFAQNEQDAAYMVLGLLPSLSEQILEGMDVEALTLELQNRSRTARHPTSPPAAPPHIPAPPPDPPLSDSATGSVVQEEPSHNGSELAGSTPSLISYPSHDRHSTGSSAGSPPSAPSEDLSASSQSWIRNMSPATTTSSLAVSSAGPSSSAASVANEDLSAVSGWSIPASALFFKQSCSPSRPPHLVHHHLLPVRRQRPSYGGK